jgi:predicted heme/steroid binding protein
MNNKNLIWLPIAIGLVSILVLGAFFLIPKNSTAGITQTNPQVSTNIQPAGNTDKDIQPVPKGSAQTVTTVPVNNTPKFTSVEVATHNSESSCYVSYQKQVYDLTNFIGRHDGGTDSILKNCGKDINDFSAMHPGGNFSSPKVQKAIKSLVVGTLE